MNKEDKIFHEQFSEYGQNAREWMRKCVLLLPEIERRKIWRKKGFSSIFEYAAKLAGMSRSTVEDALRIVKKVEAFPALKEILETRGLHRVRPVLSIVTQDTQAFWAEKAKSMSKHTLETYVQNYRLEFHPGTEDKSAKLILNISPALIERLKRIKGEQTWEECLESLLNGHSSNSANFEPVPQSVKTKSRHIPTHIQNYVRKRTGGFCAYPACTEKATSLHHTQRWALEKVHDPARIHGLCTEHERLAHLGLIENEESKPSQWRLRAEPDELSHKRYVDKFVALYRPT